MKVIEDEDLVDQQLISELRKEYGMTYNDFFMVLTDTDMKVKVRVSTLSMNSALLKENALETYETNIEKFRKLHFTCL